MTVYVWDNGKDYSDRVICIVETELDQGNVVKLLNALARPDLYGKMQGRGVILIARNAELDWLQPDRRLSLADFVDRFDYDLPYARGLDNLPMEFIDQVATELDALPNGLKSHLGAEFIKVASRSPVNTW